MTQLQHQEWLESESENAGLLSDTHQIEFERFLAEQLPHARNEEEVLKTVVRCALQAEGQDFETLTPILHQAISAHPVQKRAALMLADQILKQNIH